MSKIKWSESRDLTESGVYAIRNKVTNKVYIGSSKQVRMRMHRHLFYNSTSIDLMNDVKSYGVDEFDWAILELTDEPRKCEGKWILAACRAGIVLYNIYSATDVYRFAKAHHYQLLSEMDVSDEEVKEMFMSP